MGGHAADNAAKAHNRDEISRGGDDGPAVNGPVGHLHTDLWTLAHLALSRLP
jgi:hypothetical protein